MGTTGRSGRHWGARPRHVEWPTVAVALAIAGGFAGVVALHSHVPALVTVLALAVLGAWFGSLQHEVIHGHPTPWRWANGVIGGAPLGLFVPYWLYRDSHLEHHRDESLTDPDDDPESYYVSRATWERSGPVLHWCFRARRTLAGRMVFGPAVTVWRVGRRLSRPRSVLDAWRAARFLGGVALVLVAVHLMGLPVWEYALGAGYLGQSLSLVRSFAEHRAVESGPRSAIVRGAWCWRLLFLNNNLHLTHHRRPAVAWYQLPALHREMALEEEASEGAGVYGGYGEIVRRYFFRPFCQPVNPLRLP